MKQIPNVWLFGVFLLLLLLFFFHLPISRWEITPVLWGLWRKKSPGSCNTFQNVFCPQGFQRQGTLRRAASTVTSQTCTWVSDWALVTQLVVRGQKRQREVIFKSASDKLLSMWSWLVGKIFYLFLKVTSQINVRNKSGCEENAMLDCPCLWKMNVWIKTPRYHHFYPAQQPTRWEEANPA